MDPVLMDPDYLARIESMAHRFGADGIPVFGCECHLSAGGGKADFGFKLPESVVLSRCLEGAPDPRLAALAAAWQEPELAQAIADVWFEYDLPAEGVTSEPPSLFFTGDARTALPRTVALLKGTEFLERMRPAVERAWAALPAGARQSLWGVTLPRDLPAIRLCAKGIAPERIRPFLECQGWTGDAGRLDEVLGWRDENVAWMVLDWDVGTGVYPKVGVEYYFRHPLPPQAPYPWEALLETLTRRGLCPERTAQALRAFPGATDAVQELPERIQTIAALLGREAVFARKPSHFKIVIDEAGQLAAKVYLEIQLCWKT